DSKLFAKPAEREAGSLSDTHHVPAAGNPMTKRVKPSAVIERRPVGRRKHDTRGSDRRADRAWMGDSHANGTSGLVSGARHDGRAFNEARRRCGFTCDACTHFR